MTVRWRPLIRPQLAACSLAIVFTACDDCINENTADIWQLAHQESQVPGFRNFKPIDCNADIGWRLFSYELPADSDPARVLPTLRMQIAKARPPMFAVNARDSTNGCWSAAFETSTELQLQCPTVTYGSRGYDEWRFRVDTVRRRVIAMYSNLDAEDEREQYDAYLLPAFRHAYAKQ